MLSLLFTIFVVLVCLPILIALANGFWTVAGASAEAVTETLTDEKSAKDRNDCASGCFWILVLLPLGWFISSLF